MATLHSEPEPGESSPGSVSSGPVASGSGAKDAAGVAGETSSRGLSADFHGDASKSACGDHSTGVSESASGRNSRGASGGWRPPVVEVATGMRSALDMATAGAELAGIVIVLTLLGYWIDSKLGSLPWATAGLGVFGVFGGLLRLVRQAMRIMDQANHPSKSSPHPRSRPPK